MKRLFFALILGGGVWLIGTKLAPVMPREVEVHVRLAAFRDEATGRASEITVAFERGNDTVRAVTERFGAAGPPVLWQHTIDLPEGDYSAVVTVNVNGHTVRRTTQVHAHAGAPLEVMPPANE
jgi:hypothetical protein